jgi:hypothetical protein
MQIKEKEKVEYTLTALDRCDRCNAQALVSAKGVNGELLFCGHHYQRYEQSLSNWAYEIIDEREKLVQNKLQGSSN